MTEKMLSLFKRKSLDSFNPVRQAFVEKALSYQGHRAQANLVSGFGEKVGYGSQPWSGSFIDVVAREVDLYLPSLVYTGSGLAEFLRLNQVVAEPLPGDIVFFAFAGEGAGSPFEMPHVGVVVNTERFSETGFFQTVEAQVSTGLPRGNQDPSGVFVRVRSEQDVLVFARPDFGKSLSLSLKVNPVSVPLTEIQVAHLTTGRGNGKVQLLQEALRARVGLRREVNGLFDSATKAGFARFQRLIGRVGKDASGHPDSHSLSRLGKETGLFTGRE